MLLFRALASGSSGNAYLLRTEKVTLLFEAGLPLQRLTEFLAAEGVSPDKITAVLISHEHRDHCVSARDLATEYGATVCANVGVLRAVGLHDLSQSQALETGRPALFGDVEVTCFPVEHDAVAPVGFLIRVRNRTIAIATDVGTPTPPVVEAVAAADLVVLEANHDSDMLHNGSYPFHLRKRVAGPTGHLSNTQSAGILARHAKGEDAEVWLAHLSKHNNTPDLAVRTVRSELKLVGLSGVSVEVARRDRPSLRWTGAGRPRQLPLFGAL